MKAAHPVWNWGRLLLLAVSSYLAFAGFGLGFPFFSSDQVDESTPFHWKTGLIFSVLNAFVFLLCLDDSRQRRAALAAFGVSALLTGPAYVWNGERLVAFAPVSSPCAPPHLPLGLTLLCWGASAGLVIWWLRGPSPSAAPKAKAALLFSGLVLILLVIPWATNLCGIESMRITTAMPASADALRQNDGALTHFLVQNEADSVGDVCGFLVQSIGLAVSALMLVFIGIAAGTGWFNRKTAGSPAPAFPSRADIIPLLVFTLGGLLFAFTASIFTNLERQFVEIEHTMERHIYPYHAGFLLVKILPGIVFLAGSWLVLQRIRTASQLRFGFTVLVLIASAGLSLLSICEAHHAFRAFGILALILSIWKIAVVFQQERRSQRVVSTFAAPGETALAFALHGSLIFAVLASALMAVAIELAVISVFAIKYFIMWGTALKPFHGVAPTEKIVPMMAPSLASVTVAMGPAYFALCLFMGVMTVLLFSLFYSGTRGGAKLLYRWRKALRTSRPTTSPDTLIERHLGDARI
jgi:hypothetical protein